jgi:hypothetical protein
VGSQIKHLLPARIKKNAVLLVAVNVSDPIETTFMLWRVLALLCSVVCCQASNWIKLSSNEKVGFVDFKGDVIVPFAYEQATELSEGLAALLVRGQWTIIDVAASIVSSNGYQSIDPFSEGLAAAQLSNKWGFIDSFSHWSIPPGFGRVRRFSEGKACGELADGWHYMDRSGKLLAGPFQAAYPFRNGLGIVVVSNKWGILGHDFVFKIQPEFEEITMYESHCVRVKRAGKWGLINAQLHQIVPCDYDWIGDLFEGAAAANRNGRWGWVFPDSTSTPLLYEFAGRFAEGRAAFGRNKKYGFVDRAMRVVITENYDEVMPFSEGVAWVRSGSKWGAIDHNGQLAFPMAPYLSVTSFHEGIAIVATSETLRKGKFYLISRSGKVIWPKQ